MSITGTTKILKIIYFSLITFLLSACAAAPTRLDTEEFKLLQEGRVPANSSQAFTDCLMDGFNKAHFMLSNINIQQQRRSDLYRVESYVDTILLVSADVFDDGRVLLLESSSAALINTTGEKNAFEECLKQYGTAQPEDVQ